MFSIIKSIVELKSKAVKQKLKCINWRQVIALTVEVEVKLQNRKLNCINWQYQRDQTKSKTGKETANHKISTMDFLKTSLPYACFTLLKTVHKLHRVSWWCYIILSTYSMCINGGFFSCFFT